MENHKLNKSNDLECKTKNTNNLSKSESKELERLADIFGKKFSIIDIVGNFVYGYIENKKEYLGTKEDYYKYRKLKHQKSTKKRND